MDPITSIVGLVKTGVDKIFPDAGEAARNEVNAFIADLTSRMEILKAELQGNWLQRSWRPLLMVSITAILVNNYLVFPYLASFGVPVVMLDFPDKLWNLLMIGVGGYVVGRSAEKGIKTWKG
jgi:hypothetical protein